MSKTPKAPDADADRPSAPSLVELNKLLAGPESADRSRRAWSLIVGAIGNPDFHAVLDFALDRGLALACEAADPNPTWLNPLDHSEMVWIPPGRFFVGEDDRPAECGGFSLARYPVTNAQFQRFLDETGYEPDYEGTDESGDGYENARLLQHWLTGKPPQGKENHPVVFVSYPDALAYCRWAGLTLPGEFLWEKAARGPDGRDYPWGSEKPAGGILAHVRHTDTCPVNQYDRVRSPFGCSGLIGNVSEWCQPGDEKAPGDFPLYAPAGKAVHRGKPAYAAVRGSAFLRGDPRQMRACHRRKLAVIRRNRWVGFRPAMLLPCRPAV
jgi:serine/threonine-protein kinase